jgi:hypothetical protein
MCYFFVFQTLSILHYNPFIIYLTLFLVLQQLQSDAAAKEASATCATIHVENLMGQIKTYDVECHTILADYHHFFNIGGLPRKPYKLILHSHDFGLGLHPSDTEPDSAKKMFNLYTVCQNLIHPKPAYTVSIMGVADKMISDCHAQMEKAGLANLDSARSSHTLTWKKTDKFTQKHRYAFNEDVEFFVVGYQTEDGKHPGESIPGKWPLKTNLDTKVMEFPNLRHRIIDPKTGKAANLAENNAYCAFSVSFFVLCEVIYLFCSCM